MVKNIAVIPARSGSTRIQNKNIYPFKGKPLFAWTIEAALKSEMFDNIIISTDSKEYLEIASEYGIFTPFLRDKYADSASSCTTACYYAATQAEEYYKEKYDIITLLQATCPLRDYCDIRKTVDFFNKNHLTVLTTATKYTMNPWWCATMDENNKPTFVLYSPEECSSQSQPPMYCPNGAITICKKEYLSRTDNIYTDNLKFFELDWKHSIDIDDIKDIDMAEFLYDYINR